uniref:RNA helicase n=1 Tax=Culex tarsalis TaxID=7177 RepID=A0A1Q3EW10_CULTA
MEDEAIRITHYINPHMFWYKPESAYVHNLEEKRFQLKIDEYCQQHFRRASSDSYYDGFPGEVVAVLDFDRNKWCRCVVDEIIEDGNREKRYILWAIDDGAPIQSSSRFINPLPDDLTSEATIKVKRGSIKNVLPSECVYDPNEDKVVAKVTNRWDPNAVTMLQSIIQNGSEIYFRNVTRHKVCNVLTHFGDLEIVTRGSRQFDATRVLTETRRAYAVEPRDFIAKLSEIQTMSENRYRLPQAQENGKNGQAIKPTTPGRPYRPEPNQTRSDLPSNFEINGVNEEDFDESASMIRPNTTGRPRPPQQQSYEKAIPENSNSDEDLYPLAPERSNGTTRGNERAIFQQKTRKPNPQSLGDPRVSKSPVEPPKASGFEPSNRSNANSTVDGSPEQQPPKSTVSFASKLEMRKKLRAASKATPPAVPEQQPPKSKYDTPLNLIPAGFNMGNISFENGRAVAGGGSSDSSERKAKQPSPGGFKLRQSAAAAKPTQQQHQQQVLQVNGRDDSRESSDFSGAGGKVYMSKTTSRFEQYVDEEACIRSKLTHQRLLVHGKRPVKPVDTLENVNFCEDVHRELAAMRFRSIQRIQTYGWPHILRGNSFFCVNAAETGKTFTYLPAICSSVVRLHKEDLVPKGAGPLAIVICRSSREVQRVASYCKRILNSSINKSMSVLEAFGARDIPKVCNLLLNSCAILVSTAPAYRRLYENMPNAFVRDRIQTVVIDDIDVVVERFASELQLLCKNCDKPELQMVVTATYWNPMFAGFLRKYKNMIICIGAYLEAAIYGKSKLMLKVLRTHNDADENRHWDAKLNEVVEFLNKNNYQNERTLVCCSEPSEVCEIVERLKSQSITHMFCNDSTMLTKMDGFRNWDKQPAGEMLVMVCYDAILPDLEICMAQHIIHFSLAKSWTSFTRRFACAFGFYSNPFVEAGTNQQQQQSKTASSLIMLDENNNEQLPTLVKFLQIHNHNVPDAVLKLANNIRIQQEEQKMAVGNPVDFCHQLLDFGKCRSNGCRKRHVFTTSDLPVGAVPTTGIIKMKIFAIFSPTHYAVRVLEHRDYGARGWTKVNDSNEFFQLDMKLQQHFSNEDRHCSHGNVHHNDWCVIFDEHRYWRCRIMSMEPKKENSSSRMVKVKLLDIGRTLDCVSTELLHLPDEFRRLPAQAIDVRIVGVVPHDFETEWDKRVTATIRTWIEKYTKKEEFHVEGKVLLAVKDTIWVDTIRLVEHLSQVNTEIHEINVKTEIVGNKNFGVTDKEPLELLTQMVADCEAFRKRARDGVSSESEDEGVNLSENAPSPRGSDEFFRGEGKLTEIDKPEVAQQQPPKGLLRPMEFSDTDSDDCASEVVDNNADESKEDKQVEKVEEQILVPVRKFSEVYDELRKDETSEVFISYYYAPDNFYVCRVSQFVHISAMIANFTKEETNLVPLEQPQVGAYCLVLYDNGYQRAKITQIDDPRDIRVFFLDLGGFETYLSVDLFQLPDDLLKASAFCAIKAEVACLLPREEGETRWSDEVSDRIYDEVLANYERFNAEVIEQTSRSPVDVLIHCHTYRLLLSGPEPEPVSWLFDDIVDRKLARYIEEERPNSIDFNFDDAELKELFAPDGANQQPRLQPVEETDDSGARIEEIVESKEQTKTEEQPQAIVSSKLALLKQRRLRKKKSSSNPMNYPRLKCDFRSPKTIWRQDDALVVIRVSAPEYVKYDLTIDTDSVKLCYVHEGEKYLLSLVLFAAIRPEHAIHEVRGLSIMIRLVKLVQTMQWPSLMRQGDKVPWLQQSLEVPNSDETDCTEGFERAQPTVPNLDMSDDSFSEEPEFSDQYDRFDPIEDDYFLRDD